MGSYSVRINRLIINTSVIGIFAFDISGMTPSSGSFINYIELEADDVGNYAFQHSRAQFIDSNGTPKCIINNSVGESAFYDCIYLEEISLGLEISLGASAFRDCIKLEKFNSRTITDPDDPESYEYNLLYNGIGSYAFYNCPSIERITIPDDSDFNIDKLQSAFYVEQQVWNDNPDIDNNLTLKSNLRKFLIYDYSSNCNRTIGQILTKRTVLLAVVHNNTWKTYMGYPVYDDGDASHYLVVNTSKGLWYVYVQKNLRSSDFSSGDICIYYGGSTIGGMCKLMEY